VGAFLFLLRFCYEKRSFDIVLTVLGQTLIKNKGGFMIKIKENFDNQKNKNHGLYDFSNRQN